MAENEPSLIRGILNCCWLALVEPRGSGSASNTSPHMRAVQVESGTFCDLK